MNALSNKVYAYWFDPTNGKYNIIKEVPFHNEGNQSFALPGKNSTGETDWVLLFTSKKI